MAVASFHVQLKTTPNADDTYSLRIRIIKNRQSVYLNLGIRLKEGQYNEAGTLEKPIWVRSTNKEYRSYNDSIKAALKLLYTIREAYPQATAKEIKGYYEDAPVEGEEPALPPTGILHFMQVLADRFRKSEREAYARQLEYSLLRLRDFAGEETQDEVILTPSFMASFHAHLKAQKMRLTDRRKYTPKSLKVYFDAIINAYKQGTMEGMVRQSGNPFAQLDLYVPPKKQPRPDTSLIATLFNLELTNPEHFHARNTFLLLFLLHGARASEIIQLEWINVEPEQVSYLPGKKAAKWKRVPRNPMLNKVLAHYTRQGRYVLPYLSESPKTAQELYDVVKAAKDRINTALKTICRKHKLPRITTHHARRMFTDAALEKNIDIREVQHLVGWSTIGTAERYAKDYEQGKIEEASKKIFGE